MTNSYSPPLRLSSLEGERAKGPVIARRKRRGDLRAERLPHIPEIAARALAMTTKY
jgi:hypothetical protein